MAKESFPNGGHYRGVPLYYIHSISAGLCLQNGLSPLYAASLEGHTDIVVILIKGSADIHQGTTEVYIIISDIFLKYPV